MLVRSERSLTRSWTLHAVWQVLLGSLELRDNPLGLGSLSTAVLDLYRVPWKIVAVRVWCSERTRHGEGLARLMLCPRCDSLQKHDKKDLKGLGWELAQGASETFTNLAVAVVGLVPSLVQSRIVQFSTYPHAPWLPCLRRPTHGRRCVVLGVCCPNAQRCRN